MRVERSLRVCRSWNRKQRYQLPSRSPHVHPNIFSRFTFSPRVASLVAIDACYGIIIGALPLAVRDQSGALCLGAVLLNLGGGGGEAVQRLERDLAEERRLARVGAVRRRALRDPLRAHRRRGPVPGAERVVRDRRRRAARGAQQRPGSLSLIHISEPTRPY